MSRRRTVLWTGLVVVVAAIVLALLDAPTWMRAPFGLAVVAFVPGYALVEVLDPRGRLGGAEHVALAIGTSIAIALVGGLVVSGSPACLQPVSWTAALGGFAIVVSLLALHVTREPGVARARGMVVAPGHLGAVAETGAVFALTAVLALALTSAAATGTLGSEQSVEQGRASVLQLWAVPGDAGSIDVGIENPTGTPVECVLVVRHGSSVIRDEPLLLEPDDAKRLRVQPAAEASIMFPVEVALITPDGSRTLRRVAVWPEATAHWTTQAIGPEG